VTSVDVYKGFQRCKIKNWKERSIDRVDWEKSIKEAVVPSVKMKKEEEERNGFIHTLASHIKSTCLYFDL